MFRVGGRAVHGFSYREGSRECGTKERKTPACRGAAEFQVLGFAMRTRWLTRPRFAMRTNLEAGSGVCLAAVEVQVVSRRGDVQFESARANPATALW